MNHNKTPDEHDPSYNPHPDLTDWRAIDEINAEEDRKQLWDDFKVVAIFIGMLFFLLFFIPAFF